MPDYWGWREQTSNAHRMLISRNKLLDEQIQIIQPYFDLYGNVIRIEKNKVKELEDALEQEKRKRKN